VKDGEEQKYLNVTAAGSQYRSAGPAVAVSASASPAWRKISGECPATASPGNARTAENGTDTGISENGVRGSG